MPHIASLKRCPDGAVIEITVPLSITPIKKGECRRRGHFLFGDKDGFKLSVHLQTMVDFSYFKGRTHRFAVRREEIQLIKSGGLHPVLVIEPTEEPIDAELKRTSNEEFIVEYL